MQKIVWLLGLLLIAIVAEAQTDPTVAKIRCGDMKRDTYEVCDVGQKKEAPTEDLCETIADWIGIDMQCDEDRCICLPPINTAFCGNKRREGVEMCDPGAADDYCTQLGEAMNLSLKCNPKTCGCDFVDPVPKEYDPEYLEKLASGAIKPEVCGDKELQGGEECDPPNTLCTTNTGDPGICRKDCKCVPPESIEPEPETLVNATNVTETNITAPVENVTPENVTEAPPENITEVTPPSEPGFFARLWRWITSLFS
jgi:hypothetical protein